MKFDIRVSGKTIKSFDDIDSANVYKDFYKSVHLDKVVVIRKDYGRAGE